MSEALSSSFTVRSSAGEPFAIVQVQNLQAVIPAASDAWGRPNRLQPVSISAELSFALPFDTAATDDRLGNDTVHYGTLSQAILESLTSFSTNTIDSAPTSLHDILQKVWATITGQSLHPSKPSPVFLLSKPFLTPEQLARVAFISVTVALPKASLLGEAVSLTGSSSFLSPQPNAAVTNLYGISLAIHRLRVPTLVGINPNERLAKQFVITTVTIDKFVGQDKDIYTDLEALVVNTLESSSFETLEALGAHLADCILTKYRSDEDACHWLVHIRMEKPIATPLADYPVVEIRAGCAFPAIGRPSLAGLESPHNPSIPELSNTPNVTMTSITTTTMNRLQLTISILRATFAFYFVLVAAHLVVYTLAHIVDSVLYVVVHPTRRSIGLLVQIIVNVVYLVILRHRRWWFD